MARIPIAFFPTGISETRKVKAQNLRHCQVTCHLRPETVKPFFFDFDYSIPTKRTNKEWGRDGLGLLIATARFIKGEQKDVKVF